jgi:hypothetical protein
MLVLISSTEWWKNMGYQALKAGVSTELGAGEDLSIAVKSEFVWG